jgi:peptide/nickel transport system permease protein
MIRFIVRRLAMLVLMFLLVSVLVFLLLRILPGDVVTMTLGRFASEDAKETLRAELGLDRPLVVQYGSWLVNFVQGDWGYSVSLQASIGPVVREHFINSFYLAFLAMLLFVPLGILFGLLAGLRRGTWIDNLLSISALAFIGLPEFVIGLALISVFAVQTGWLSANATIAASSNFFEILPLLILPAITVALTSLAYVTRMTRASTVEVMKMDYVRTARLKGLPPRKVLTGHVLRNSLMPTVTVVAVTMGWLVGGLIITETLFAYPGLGSLTLYGIQRRDVPLIQATTMLIVAVVMLANLAADIIYAYLNPKIRY